MKNSYLEVTFRHGRPLVAYLYLPRQSGDSSFRVKKVEPGLLVDFTEAGKPIGIEITAPRQINVSVLNRLLVELGASQITQDDVSPLLAA